MSTSVLISSLIPNVPVRRGKVRDIYDFGDRLLIVATDRISAFDWVLPTAIPDKGRMLTKISEFWFHKLEVPHHLLTTDISTLPSLLGTDMSILNGRSMVVRKTTVVPIECVVRGYLAGSGWKEYQESGTVCDVELPSGLMESSKLPEPIFTPATKEKAGHDVNISFERMCEIVGQDLAERLRTLSLEIYRRGAKHALKNGIIIADTKFEFGQIGDELLLIDEVLTPDSSRFWPENEYAPGRGQASFDKQFVRDWLEASSWDKESAPPTLPHQIATETRNKYIEAYARLTNSIPEF